MLLFRPIRGSDLAGLVALASSIDGGLTTLPANSEILRERIDASLRSFATRVSRPGGEHYFFVLEDTASGAVVGTSGLVARVGGYEPFYSYEIRSERYSHPPLKIEKEISVLHLKEIHRGPSEICSLFLHPEYRRAGAGRLLSLSRFLFLGTFPGRFDATVIAELRGYLDQTGKSPFWEAVGRPFFDFDFYAADLLSGLGDKAFIADLMPDHPIYVPLLPNLVQAAIGRVHANTEPALALLLAEGFERTAEVDIFDAGPLLRAPSGSIRTVRTLRTGRLRPFGEDPAVEPLFLVARASLDFRATLGALRDHGDGTVSLTGETATSLELDPGEVVTFSPAR